MQPEEWVDAVRALLAERAARAEEASRLAASLPALVADWQVGERRPSTRPATELLVGGEAQGAFWDALLRRAPPRAPVAVVPELAPLVGVLARLDDDQRARLAGTASRVITRADALLGDAAAAFASPAIEVRTATGVRGWSLVDPGRFAVLPVHGDDPDPAAIVVTREPAVVAALAASFDDLWLTASPIEDGERPGDAVLSLLGQGLSDGAIATRLGWSVRTVRRRIAEAAAARGVASRFALGAAWERGR